MTKAEAKNYGFISRMNNRERTPFDDKKFFDRVSEERPAKGSNNEDWATLFDAWLEGWDSANDEYTAS